MMMNDEIYLAKLITCSLRRLRYTVAAIVRDSPNTLYPIYIQKADVTSKIMKVEYMESVVTIQTKTILIVDLKRLTGLHIVRYRPI